LTKYIAGVGWREIDKSNIIELYISNPIFDKFVKV